MCWANKLCALDDCEPNGLEPTWNQTAWNRPGILSAFRRSILRSRCTFSTASCMRACATSPVSSANATLCLTHSWHGGHLAQRSCSVGLDTARRVKRSKSITQKCWNIDLGNTFSRETVKYVNVNTSWYPGLGSWDWRLTDAGEPATGHHQHVHRQGASF